MPTSPQSCLMQSPYADGKKADIPTWLYSHGCTTADIAGDDSCDVICSEDSLDCRLCGPTGMFLQQIQPRICSLCPAGTKGVNGLYCDVCPGLREATPLRDACICKPPAVWVAPNSCACPTGYVLSPDMTSCVPCPESSVRRGLMELSETLDKPSDTTQCTECPPGSTSDSTFTECVQCPQGMFREAVQVGCHTCLDPETYARDATDSSSCLTCETGCEVGFRAVP